jgi:hypothetical protein
MALQIRRGLEAGRAAVTPAPGELLFTTDQSKLYIGDGATVGGTLVTGSGIGNIVEDTTPQLGGDLDVNSHSIVSTSNGNIILDPNGSGTIQLNANITTTGNITKTGELNISPTLLTSFGSNNSIIDGNVFITRNTHSTTYGAGFTFAQHHATADAVNFGFYRTRGTGLVPTAVLNGDDLADISFFAWDGTARAGGASISATVEGTPSTGHVPTKFSFATDNGTIAAVRAELSSAGVWKVNSIQNFSGSTLTLTATTVNVAGDLQLNAQGDLKFADADNSNYVAFQAPATVSANITWTLPSIDGGSGQVLSTNGSGTLSWISASGAGSDLVNDTSPQLGGDLDVNGKIITSVSNGNVNISPNGSGNILLTPTTGKITLGVLDWPTTAGSNGQVLTSNGSSAATWTSAGALQPRNTAAATTASLANLATENITITGFKGYALYKIQTSGASWVRLYTDVASRSADSARLEGVDPLPGSGVIAEVITTGAETILISPGIFGFSGESPTTTAIPATVTNKTGGTTTITVTVTILQLEA